MDDAEKELVKGLVPMLRGLKGAMAGMGEMNEQLKTAHAQIAAFDCSGAPHAELVKQYRLVCEYLAKQYELANASQERINNFLDAMLQMLSRIE
jgi:hypothetical protein